MTHLTRAIVLAVAVAAVAAPRPADAQANSYLGLWGRVFDGAPGGGPPPPPPPPHLDKAAAQLAERLRGAAEEWRAEAEELRGRLMQRLSGGGDGATAAAAPLPPLLNGEKAPKSEPSEAAGLLDRLHEALPLDGDVEPRHLAALAALGLLSARRHGAAAGAASLPPINVDADAPGLPRLPALSEVGVLLPEAVAGPRFAPRLCARLQNFGNAPGYRSAYLGAAPCASHANASAATVGWGAGVAEAAFTLECWHPQRGQQAQHVQHQEAGGLQGLRAAAAQAASQLGAALQQRQGALECSLAVATSNTTGALLRHELAAAEPAAAFGLAAPPPRLSALRLRACNLPPSSLQAPARLRANHTALEVRELRLNGRRVAGTALAAAQVAAGSGRECQAALVRLPPRALADGFVLTGALGLDGGAGTWGVGEMASLDLQLGGLSLLAPGPG